MFNFLSIAHFHLGLSESTQNSIEINIRHCKDAFHYSNIYVYEIKHNQLSKNKFYQNKVYEIEIKLIIFNSL